MASSRILLSGLCASLMLAACSEPASTPSGTASAAPAPAAAPMAMSHDSMQVGNIITGDGIPQPNPVVTRNWGDLPAGRTWGSTAGIDIDPTDGNVVAYERCGAGSFGAGAPAEIHSDSTR